MKLPLKLKNIRHICAADWEVNTMQNKSMFQTLKDMPSSQKNIERLKQTWCNSEDTVVCIGLLIGAVIGILTFIVLTVVTLVTYRNSGSYKNEEAFM